MQGVTGSIPVVSTKNESDPSGSLSFLSNPKDWYVIMPFGRVCNLRLTQHGITR